MNMIVSQVSASCRFAAKELPERNGGRGFLISDLAKVHPILQGLANMENRWKQGNVKV